MRKGKRIFKDADGVLLVGVWIDNHTEHVRAATAKEIAAHELEQPQMAGGGQSLPEEKPERESPAPVRQISKVKKSKRSKR